MHPLLIYVFAALGDIVVSSTLFAGAVRVAEMGLSARAVAGVIAAWAASYMLTSQIVGGRLTRANAGSMLIGASLAAAAISAAFLLCRDLLAIYALTSLIAVAIAFFFTPFQIFMKEVDRGRRKRVTYSVGVYVFSWSTGFAVGPFLSGYLWEWTDALGGPLAGILGFAPAGWMSIHLVNVLVSLGMALGLWRLQAGRSTPAPAQADQAQEGAEYQGMPCRAWLAWAGAGAGVLVAVCLRAILPKESEVLGLSKSELGKVLFAMSMTQAVCGLALYRGKLWMYRPLPLILSGLFGAAGLHLFACADRPIAFVLASIYFGIYCGFFYFYFVFHPIIHPTRSARYMAINESIVGLTGLLSLGAGMLVDRFGSAAAYYAGAACILTAVLAQALVHLDDREAVATLEQSWQAAQAQDQAGLA